MRAIAGSIIFFCYTIALVGSEHLHIGLIDSGSISIAWCLWAGIAATLCFIEKD